MNTDRTPKEAIIYPNSQEEQEFFRTLHTKQELDFARNLIILSRQNDNKWLEKITTNSYHELCTHYGIKFEDAHFLCFEKFVKIGYLEKIEGSEYVHRITKKFIGDTHTLRDNIQSIH